MVKIKPEKKKIALLLESLDLGGIGRVTLILAEGFAKQGYDVDLVVGKKQGLFLEQVPSNVNLVDLRVSRLVFSLNRIAAYLKQAKPDLLISAKERVNVAALLARRLSGVNPRLIVSVHANNSAEIANYGASLYRKIIISTARRTYRWADRVVAVSEGVADDVANLFLIPREEISVIHNPILNKDLKDKMNEPVDHPWFKKGDYRLILGMGRLVKQKDFLTLIRSFVLVKKAVPEAKLMIFGDGRERKLLEREIRSLNLYNDVSMPGLIENPFKYLAKADLFVLSSNCEALPTVLIEAMATGTPVVSTDCPSGPSEILDNGKYGPLVPVGDSKALARAVLNVLKDPTDRELLINRANDFTVDKAVEKYLDLIKGLYKG